MIGYLLIDLDDTLYPASSPLGRVISENINTFASHYLGVSVDEARRLRRDASPVYGSTMSWLMAKHGLTDLDAYMSFVHPKNIGDYVSRDERLPQTLEGIELPKAILTNSPARHAYRVLEFLQIEHLFERVFDISHFGYRGKPNRAVYEKTLAEIGRTPPEVLFVDDQIGHLIPFRAMGGNAVLVDENDGAADGLPRMRSIHELPELLKRLSEGGALPR